MHQAVGGEAMIEDGMSAGGEGSCAKLRQDRGSSARTTRCIAYCGQPCPSRCSANPFSLIRSFLESVYSFILCVRE